MTATSRSERTLELSEREATTLAQEFLVREADLLDHDRCEEWLELLHPTLVYRAPVRVTRPPNQGDGLSDKMYHFDETLRSLTIRVKLQGSSAWAEEPPSRTRRFVSNVRGEWVTSTEIEVVSYLLLTRLRLVETQQETIVGERHDRLVHDDDAVWRLRRRDILLDHTTLPVHNLAMFL